MFENSGLHPVVVADKRIRLGLPTRHNKTENKGSMWLPPLYKERISMRAWDKIVSEIVAASDDTNGDNIGNVNDNDDDGSSCCFSIPIPKQRGKERD